MVHSLTFWLVLLVSVPVYWCLPPRLRHPFLAVASLGYLVHLEPVWTLVLLAWVVAFYLAARKLGPAAPRSRQLLVGCVLSILAYLAAFKYVPQLWNAIGRSVR